MAKKGRPSKFTQKLADQICGLLADGLTLREVCRDDDMPHESTVRHWALTKPEFFTQYTSAREIGYMSMADEVLEIADNATNDWMERRDQKGEFTGDYMLNNDHYQRSRLRIDTRKWLLSKALPKVFGDKVEHKVEQTINYVSEEPLTPEEWANQYGKGVQDEQESVH